MTRKRLITLAAILAILGALVYLQFREWRSFDWDKFWDVSAALMRGRGLRHLVIAACLVYLTYYLRAIRWKIFLKPVCHTRVAHLLPSQYIGFTGLALLGRPGEFVRPYLIARREGLTFSSQMAVWTVERIFDIGAFTTLMSINIFLFGDRRIAEGAAVFFNRIGLHRCAVYLQRNRLPHGLLHFAHRTFGLPWLGVILLALVAVLALAAGIIHWRGLAVAGWLQERFPTEFGKTAAHKIRAFREGLNTIHDTASFLQLAGVSLAIWLIIPLAYRYVVHAYPYETALRQMHVPQVMLLVASSMVGSMIQLPAVGGGSQLAVISMLSSPEWFGCAAGATVNCVSPELAVSAGILLWLVTFMAVIPIGLALARYEHISLRNISAAAE